MKHYTKLAFVGTLVLFIALIIGAITAAGGTESFPAVVTEAALPSAGVEEPPPTIDVELAAEYAGQLESAALRDFYERIYASTTTTTIYTPPPTTAAPVTQPIYVPPSPSSSGVDAHLHRIAQCESGGNPSAVNPTGSFRGAWQFWHDGNGSTWLAYGGGQFASDPIYATYDQQLVIARAVYAGQGSGAWPICQYR